MSPRVPALAVVALVITACAAPASGPSTSAADRSGLPSDAAPEGIPDAVWTAILTDLERQTGGSSDPEVVSAEAVTWNDGSLGCPEPGQAYTQAIVDGYQVVLEVAGERYDYRVGSGASVKLCDRGPLEGGG
jgi:hypothetical protein